MVFSSALFLTLFLPAVLLLYWLVRKSFRVILLVFASLLFYAWGEPKAVLCMVAMIIVNFFGAKWIASAKAALDTAGVSLTPPVRTTVIGQH